MKTFLVIILMICATVQGFAQHPDRSGYADTSVITRFNIGGPEFSVAIPAILLTPSSSEVLGTHVTPPFDIPTGLGLRSTPHSYDIDNSPQIRSTLFLTPPHRDSMKPVRIVLGVAQAAGAAYAVYEHLRKYRHRY